MREVRAALAAVAFLTRVPIPRAFELTGDDVARGIAWFPVVGAALGGTVGLVTWAGAKLVPATLAAAVAVALGVVLSGALHVDALADAADALGARTREGALEIMRDHAIGSYGAAAIALALLVRVLALAALVGHGPVRYAVAAGGVSRFASVTVGALQPYARPDCGLGAAVAQRSPVRVMVAAVFAVAIALAVARADGAALVLTGGLVAAASAVLSARWLGGVTGDTLGATSEVAEVAGLVVAAALV